MKLKNKIFDNRKTLSSVLVIVIAIFAVHLAVNYLDIEMPVLNPHNEEQPDKQKFSFYCDYPPFNYTTPHIEFDENGTAKWLPHFSLTITYYYEGILAEGTDFLLTVEGSLYPEGQKLINRVGVGYDGATFADGSLRNYSPLFDAALYDSEIYSVHIPPQGEIRVLRIKWNAAGDYYQYLIITYNNMSQNRINLQDGKVHVFGIDTLLQEEYNQKQESIDRRNMAIMVDLGALVSVDHCWRTY